MAVGAVERVARISRGIFRRVREHAFAERYGFAHRPRGERLVGPAGIVRVGCEGGYGKCEKQRKQKPRSRGVGGQAPFGAFRPGAGLHHRPVVSVALTAQVWPAASRLASFCLPLLPALPSKALRIQSTWCTSLAELEDGTCRHNASAAAGSNQPPFASVIAASQQALRAISPWHRR